MTDPLHMVASEDSAWTTVNIGEAFPGLQYPLSWTAFHVGCERGVRRSLNDLGGFTRAEIELPDVVEHRLLAIFHGRCAGSVDSLRMVMDRLPGNSGDRFERLILGSVRPGLPNHRILRRYPLAIAKTLRALLRSVRDLECEAAVTRTWWTRLCIDGSRSEPAAVLLAEAQERLECAFRRHFTVRMLGQGMFDRLQALIDQAGLGPEGLGLACGYGGSDESVLLDDLLAVRRGERTLDEFVARHGFHGPAEGDLASRSWREDRTPLESWLAAPEVSVRSTSAVAESRDRARDRLLHRLPVLRRPPAALTMRLTRHFVVHGELGKATFLTAYDGMRYALRLRGSELVASGVLEDPADVFHLTVDEAFAADLSAAEAAELCAARRELRAEYADLVLPQAWVGPAPRVSRAGSASVDGPVDGIGASPGVVRGPARVVLNPADVELVDGEILVCEFTDPAWTPHIYRAAALVIDIGAAMSHGAIVAREFGVPCVIGTRDGTVRIRTGDLLEVDGAAGIVRVL